MTRIIAGELGGRRIAVPARGTRPTAERVREALFSSLAADRALVGLRVLDLFAGSGALALEALSRGCHDAVLVESDQRAARLCVRNAASLGLTAVVVVAAVPVDRWLRRNRNSGRFDLVFLDPPYELTDDAVAGVLAQLCGNDLLRRDARLILERSRRSAAPEWPTGCGGTTSRRFGETVLHQAVWYGP